MKILQLGKFYPIRGGVEKVMWSLTFALAERGVACDMLCAMLREDNFDADHAMLAEETPEARVIKLGPDNRIICVPALTKKAKTMLSPAMVRWLRRHAAEYDIIHIHHPDPMAALALRLSGYKGRVILHWHSDIVSQKILLAFFRPLQSWLVKRAELIIGTTPVYLRESRALKDVQDKTTCVPIGISPVYFDSREAEQFRATLPGKTLVFALGRLVPYKGFGTLVAAAQYLSSDYVILIGGEGPQRDTLQKQINSLGLQNKVHLLGYVETWELPALFGACDIYVMSSQMKTEAFGIVQIEAMSCGKPVVATTIPQSGVSWVNQDGVSGLNVPPGDPEAIARAIVTICSDPDVYLQFAAGAMERFETYFTSRVMIDKIINIYESKN
ncbi:MAG: glycosyltransferase [Bacteroidales bacterium]|nr:glycosyltransferase [Bacteroidales bacterium]